jgi:hypothetical protein
LVDELELIAAAPLVTGRYQSWRPSDGVPVRTTVGQPRFWRGPALVDGRVLAPFGLLDPHLLVDESQRLYRQRLDIRADRIVATLARIATQHPGEPLVLLCFERVPGEECHRRWFAEWFEDRFGVVVPEVGTDSVSTSDARDDAPRIAQEPRNEPQRLPGL